MNIETLLSNDGYGYNLDEDNFTKMVEVGDTRVFIRLAVTGSKDSMTLIIDDEFGEFALTLHLYIVTVEQGFKAAQKITKKALKIIKDY